MGTPKDLSDEEIQYGIDRCKARLSGIMPIGIMSYKTIHQALSQYRNELQQRGILKIDF